METRKKLNRLMEKAIGIVSYVIDEAKRPSGTSSPIQSAKISGMIRVTDDIGNEYLCPAGMLKDVNFVSEREKPNCVEYSHITHHEST